MWRQALTMSLAPTPYLTLYKDESEETIKKYIKATHAAYDEMKATGAPPSGENVAFINEVHSRTTLRDQVRLFPFVPTAPSLNLPSRSSSTTA
jgi:hypothetical protein